MKIRELVTLTAIGVVFSLSIIPAQGQQTIDSGNGNVFMEEQPTANKQSPATANQKERIPVDLSNLGIPVNSKGQIVPLIQNDTGPVMESGSNLEVSRSPSVLYGPSYYLNSFGQKVDGFGNVLPPGRYLPYTPYAATPGYSATFSNQPGGNSQGMNYQGSGTVFGSGRGIGGGFGFGSGRASGGLIMPGNTQYDYRGTVRPIFPSGE